MANSPLGMLYSSALLELKKGKLRKEIEVLESKL